MASPVWLFPRGDSHAFLTRFLTYHRFSSISEAKPRLKEHISHHGTSKIHLLSFKFRLHRTQLKHEADKEQVPHSRIPVPDDSQLELLSEIRERRTTRLDRLEDIWQQAMIAIRIIVSSYAHDYQGPSREFLGMLEVELQTLIIEMISLSAEEGYDLRLEEETWDQVQ
ncbi:hypothetical protein N7516_009769 [Penicillium verrucosum]|uniref:uncharacterized protein n=1 Tax=Penicillium verrucosum TaxID=60171 RepID=UPI002545227E|nr:uncharacterized protein N7516_009769 [Penicillium verrucosum]KAJ5922066.1 hypothetical protein N7516_009769 [Penicillium verrucosum]